MTVSPRGLLSERLLLGSILRGETSLSALMELAQLEDFAEPHRLLLLAIGEATRRSRTADSAGVASVLRKQGDLERLGGAEYLEQLADAAPPTLDLAFHAGVLREVRSLRDLEQWASTLARESQLEGADVARLLQRAEENLADLRSKGTRREFISASVNVRKVFSEIERRYENPTDVTGIATGLRDLDQLTGGLQRGELMLLAGQPSTCKTSLVLHFAGSVAVEQNLPVALFSFDLDAEAVMVRLFAAKAQVDLQRLRTGRLKDEDWPSLARSADRLFRAPLFTQDAPSTVPEMLRDCLQLRRERGGLGLVAVDYLQTIPEQGPDLNRQLKSLARELNVPVVLTAQLTNAESRSADGRAEHFDLRASGISERHVDTVVFPSRLDASPTLPLVGNIVELTVARQRNGPVGTVRVGFVPEQSRFENLPEELA